MCYFQNNIDANVNRDVYIPNPSCKEFHKFEWIGKLMGACLRGKENLVGALFSNNPCDPVLYPLVMHLLCDFPGSDSTFLCVEGIGWREGEMVKGFCDCG